MLAVWLFLFRLPEMAEFISRCEEFLVEEFSPLDSQWSNKDFLSLSSNGLQKGNANICVCTFVVFKMNNYPICIKRGAINGAY